MSANDSLNSINNALTTYKGSLSQAWTAYEVQYFIQAIDKEKREIGSICSDISDLYSTIQKAYQDIRDEEEERARQLALKVK
ncbi:hypothetical protein [Lachnoclostridium sp.]|uniref:hypothetical protein n=1 Tax=Lachnoclostridium sp. TaxID=2028282 RepID=UPI00289639BC|nr:hypothetical protein [Lachnoclostridium sp.]